ncbi:hypothetical protein F3Y22_tig00111238pilonHSYRG00297 [Hibiscus syriacus]|uniref:Uncharacterized protein n=1 Tax=Hibiscus syriacus TaxID=106335 RepID=A0A6A2YUC6_HIBSY|nr:hypothetical protein F3Y22_tig00111238pilonHSYRG00297 [Hibiscus syriacus]
MSPAPTSLGSEPLTVRSPARFWSGYLRHAYLKVDSFWLIVLEARKQVVEATERLGGQYSTGLHPQCTHLVVQISFSICLLLNHLDFSLIRDLADWDKEKEISISIMAMADGYHVYCDDNKVSYCLCGCKCNYYVRLSESLYNVKGIGEHADELNRLAESTASEMFSGHTMYIDSDISVELRNKVLEEASKKGATVPLWVLKTSKDRNLQRLVHMSADLARQIGTVLENARNVIENNVANSMQSTRSIRRNALMREATDYLSSPKREDVSEHQSVFLDANGDGKDSEASFTNLTRSLTESEKNELIFKNKFLTILFPVDRFSEMGPSSRHISAIRALRVCRFWITYMPFIRKKTSVHEIAAAIHTDSRAPFFNTAKEKKGTKMFKLIKLNAYCSVPYNFSFLSPWQLLCMPNLGKKLKGILLSLSTLASFTGTVLSERSNEGRNTEWSWHVRPAQPPAPDATNASTTLFHFLPCKDTRIDYGDYELMVFLCVLFFAVVSKTLIPQLSQVHGFNISQLEAALAAVLYSQGPLQVDTVVQQLEVLLSTRTPSMVPVPTYVPAGVDLPPVLYSSALIVHASVYVWLQYMQSMKVYHPLLSSEIL